MTRKCPVENCPNNRPSAGKKPNGEQKYRARCRKHQKEWRNRFWEKQPLSFSIKATGKTMTTLPKPKEIHIDWKKHIFPFMVILPFWFYGLFSFSMYVGDKLEMFVQNICK
jgi:hypothetical protein